MRIEYWTFIDKSIESKHKTKAAALRAAKTGEDFGFLVPEVVKVTFIKRPWRK